MPHEMVIVLLGLGALLGFASGLRELRQAQHGQRGSPCYLHGRSWLFES